MADDMGEKTELPTGRKLEDARQKGQLAKSIDLSAPLEMIGAVALIWWLGPMMLAGCQEVMRALLGAAPLTVMLAPAEALRSLGWGMSRVMMIAGPLMVMMAVVAVAAQLQQVSFLFTLEPLRPKPEKLNPITGFGRIFSLRSVVKTLVSLVKLIVVGVVVYRVIMAHAQEIASLPALTALAGLGAMSWIVLKVIIWVLAMMLIIGVADWMYQRWQHTQDLKMTRHEVKDDRKESDGDPEMKARRQRIARDIATQRAKNQVPKADVVVTNPTHFAVALKYDADRMAAPVVVAKGEDYMALRIREIAAAHGVPIVERPPLARALYSGVKVGQMVKPELFEAIAEVLALVYKLDKRKAG